MHYSGVVVAAQPARVEAVARVIDALDGVEVHHAYPAEGRLIAVLETSTDTGQETGLRSIQRVDDVLFAELVFYRLDDENSGALT